MSLLKKVKDRGIVDLVHTLFGKVVPESVCRWSIAVVYELDTDKIAAWLAEVNELQWETEVVDDATKRDALRTLTLNQTPLEFCASDVGYAVIDPKTKEMVGGVWAAKDQFRDSEMGIEIHFTPQQAWIYCAYIAKESRKRGAYQQVLSYAVTDLRERGTNQVLVMVMPWNRASTWIHKRLSRKVLGRVRILRLGQKVFSRVSGDIQVVKSESGENARGPVRVTIDS